MSSYTAGTVYGVTQFICYSESNAVLTHGRYGVKKVLLGNQMHVHLDDGYVSVGSATLSRYGKANSLIVSAFASLFWGSAFGYYLKYRMKGLGHRIYQRANTFVYKIGYSHMVYKVLRFDLINSPKRFKKQYYVAVRGTDKNCVFNAARIIQSYRIPNCYCFNGIFLHGFYVEPQEGKKGFML